MYYFSKIFISFALLLILSSCGQRSASEDEELYISAKNCLDNKDYSQANKMFETLVKKYPSKRLFKQYLADSYLGMGGFELFDFLISIDRILSSSFEDIDLILEVKKFTTKYFSIGEKRKGFLLEALKIYYFMDEGFQAKSREDKLKKGLVHIFLVTQSLKNLITGFTSEVKNKNSIDELEKKYKKFVKRYIIHVDEMIYHAFRSYINLKESFDEVNTLIKEIDRAIYDVFGVPYNKISDELQEMNIEKFVELFIKYNPKLYEEFMKRVLNTCKRELGLERINLLEQTIKESYEDHEFKSEVLKVVGKVKVYVESHNEDICHSLY